MSSGLLKAVDALSAEAREYVECYERQIAWYEARLKAIEKALLGSRPNPDHDTHLVVTSVVLSRGVGRIAGDIPLGEWSVRPVGKPDVLLPREEG